MINVIIKDLGICCGATIDTDKCVLIVLITRDENINDLEHGVRSILYKVVSGDGVQFHSVTEI